MLRNKSGLRSSGLSAAVGPPITMWLPPPVAVCLPSMREFLRRQMVRLRFR